MARPRVMPTLLLAEGRLVKTVRFTKPRYIGDPLNTVRIFNDKEVDELVVLDVAATRTGGGPDFARVLQIGTQCFMPLCYGGGVRNVEDARRILCGGAEKIAVNTAAVERRGLVGELATVFGSQSVVVSIDAKRRRFRRELEVVTRGGTRRTGLDVVGFARDMEREGAGELLLTSVEREGTMRGYDLELVGAVAEAVRIPVIASGGAGNLEDLRSAIVVGASAVAASSMFVFHGRRRSVLINYPSRQELDEVFAQ